MTRTFLRAASLSLVFLALSCGKSTVTMTAIAPGAQCPTGGVSIVVDSGAPQIVCNGSNGTNGTNGANGVDGGNGANGTNGAAGFTTLVKTTTLEVGDANCAGGGQRIDSGLDNGAHGGTANDGILQPGEITSTSYVCSGSAENVGSIIAPVGSPGDSTISALGGNSDAGSGGNGGEIQIGFWNGTIGGHVKVFKTGAADPSFTFPAKPAVDLGATPANITANTTIESLDPLSTDAGAGTLYLDKNDIVALLDNPTDGGSTEVTGLSIAPGVTVTLIPLPSNPVNFRVKGPILNAGTIALANAGVQVALLILADSYFGDATSAVLNNGIDASSANGTSSGGIDIVASPLWNQGLISATGGNGSSGGNGGQIRMNGYNGSPASMFNTGIIQTTGGNGSSGSGGNGGQVLFYPYLDLNNSGPIDASGGTGMTQGGSAGGIALYGGDKAAASVRNSGTLTSKGGDVAASCTTGCAAGNGREIDVYAYAGTVVNNAAITTRGGSSANGAGGSGGLIYIEMSGSQRSAVTGNNRLVPGGDVMVSGNLNSSGGFGGTGGGGAGNVAIWFDTNYQPNGQEVILYGYSQLSASGGDGLQNGGSGAPIQMINTYYNPTVGCVDCQNRAAVVNGTGYGPGGSVINYADLIARGGTGGSGSGGTSGSVSLSTQQAYFFAGDSFEQVVNAGNIDITGGASTRLVATLNTLVPAGVRFYGLTGVTNSGTIIARGGASASGPGGIGRPVSMGSDNGAVTSTNSIDVSGGPGILQGGNASTISLTGTTVNDIGDLVALGAAATGATGSGGSGGTVRIFSTNGLSSVTVPAPAGISVSGGTAPQSGTPGSAGQVQIDGWTETSSWTH